MNTNVIAGLPGGMFRLWTSFGGACQTRSATADSAETTTRPEGPHLATVELKGVNKKYGTDEVAVHALRDIDLTLPRGQITAVWGPSGSGKSTLLNLIGLVDRPTSGRVFINGIDTGNLNESETARLRNRGIGYIFQSFNLVPVLSSLENIMLPLQIAGAPEPRKRALAILEEVDLADKADARPDKLSGGQRQRVAIARALVSEPKLVIADEPTANLDSGTSTRIMELMRKLNESHHTTFLISTHDARVLDDVDAKICLIDGMIG